MGLVKTKLILKNPLKPNLQPVEVEAIADSGAVHLCIPAPVQAQLELEKSAQKEVLLADGRKQRVPYVGPVEIRFKDRVGFAGALVLGDEVVLGVIPMEDLNMDHFALAIGPAPGIDS